MKTRRSFLTSMSSIAAGTCLIPEELFAAEDAGSPLKTISVIHSTDLHGHILPTTSYGGLQGVGGLARCATQIRRWRQENPNSLLVDVGDLYQGTQVSKRNNGALMMDLLNHLEYDAWVLGNHEFDWGLETVENVIGRSRFSTLTGNIQLSGKAPWKLQDANNAFSKIAPFTIKEVAGFRIGIVGLITPGLDFWLHPKQLQDFKATDPLPALQSSIKAMKASGVDAIIVAGHMGLKNGKDDFANRVLELTKSCPDIDLFLAGHTHKDMARESPNGTLYTQSSYHGIHLGRVDLTFSRTTNKLVHKRAFTILMDDRFPEDPLVIKQSRKDLDLANEELAAPAGKVTIELSGEFQAGKHSDISLLICRAIEDSLKRAKINTDGVFHGQFDDASLSEGLKTIHDLWKLLPYENRIVTADLLPNEIIEILNESFAKKSNSRNLSGFSVLTKSAGRGAAVSELQDQSGTPLKADKRYRIAFNSYDSRSAGQWLMRLRNVLAQKEANVTYHDIETRDALLAYFLNHQEISPAQLRS